MERMRVERAGADRTELVVVGVSKVVEDQYTRNSEGMGIADVRFLTRRRGEEMPEVGRAAR